MPLLLVLVRIAQGRGEQACGVERLQHVVADRGQEAGLGLLRQFGLARALGHALLQGLVGFEQRLLGALVVGDVVVAGDVAAAGQRLAAHLDHLAVAAGAFEHVRGAGAHVRNAAGDLILHLAAAEFAALGVVADQVGDRPADVEHAVGIAEHLLVAPVPRGQAHRRIHHADPGADVLQRGGQDLAVEAQFLPGLVEHRHHLAQVHARAAQQAGQHQTRGGRADRGGKQAFGELHPDPVGHRGGLRLAAEQLRLFGEGTAGMALADHALGQRLQVDHTHLPEPVAGHRRALRVRLQERRRAQALVQARPPARRHQHHRADVDQQRPERAVRQRIPAAHAEQLLRAQPGDAERPVQQPGRRQPAGLGQRRQQQRVDPGGEAQHHAGLHALAAGAAPVQPADHARRELRHRGEGHQAVGRQRRVVAAAAVIAVGDQRQQQDRQAADPQHLRGHVGTGRLVPAAAQQHRHHQVVADHRRQRDAGDDDHAGGGGEPAHVGDQRQRGAAFGQRQRQHDAVVGHVAAAEQRDAGGCDRHHHRRDQHQVQAEQPARLADVADVAALHYRHVELPWQAHQRQEAEQGLRDEAHRRGVLEQRACRRHHLATVAHGQPHVGEHAHRHHRQQLHHRLQRDRQHHAVVVLGGIDLASAEQRGEQRHPQGHVQRRVGVERCTGAGLAAEHLQAHRHRLVLQR
ncbi:hypothetical protein NB706_002936 [Xanthomonas sacchari]|nr:hypothetical protein [Xanthomonas sacchari]